MKYRILVWFIAFSMSHHAIGVEEKRTIKACGHHDYAPWNWLQGDKIVGVCAEAATHLFGKLGYQLDLSYVGPWKRCQQMVEQGEVDLNICSFKNTERESHSVFSANPMGSNENVLFVNKNNYFDFSGLEVLNGKLIGLVRGVSLGSELDQYLAENSYVVQVEKYKFLLAMLGRGRIDAVIIGRKTGLHLLNLYGLTNTITDTPTVMHEGDLYFSFSEKSDYVGLLKDTDKVLKTTEYKAWLASLFNHYSQMHKEFEQANIIDSRSLLHREIVN
jgi:polar amino acid transport system substrate-binding protein